MPYTVKQRMSSEFAFPDRLQQERPFGQRKYVPKVKKIRSFQEDNADGAEVDIGEIRDRPTSTLCDTEREIQNDFSYVTITVFGVDREHLKAVVDYFSNLSIVDTIETEGVEIYGLNWINVVYKLEANQIDDLKSIIEISPGYFVGCCIGAFDQEIIESEKRKHLPIFRVRKNKEDLAQISMEDKSFFAKIREFIFGEGEIHVYQGSKFSALFKYFML